MHKLLPVLLPFLVLPLAAAEASKPLADAGVATSEEPSAAGGMGGLSAILPQPQNGLVETVWRSITRSLEITEISWKADVLVLTPLRAST